MLVAQVEHKRSSAVEEGQHPDAHVELRWGRVVSQQAVDRPGGSVDFAVRNITQILQQPVETQVEPHSVQYVQGEGLWEGNAPERVVKVCLYLFIGSPFALDVDTGVATVTSGRGKGKYGEDLQLGHNEDVSWLTDWPAQTSLPLVAQTSVRKCFLTHQIDWCSKKYDKQYDKTKFGWSTTSLFCFCQTES